MYKKLLRTVALLLAMSTIIHADDQMHKVVIQVSSANPVIQKIAINNAVNIQRLYGMDNVIVELVAYGPGLSILKADNPQSKRITSLSQSDIIFSACMNTMGKIKKKTGHFPKLSEGVTKVDAGVGRIIELQEKGYAYIRP